MKQLLKNTAKHWPYFLMALPVVIILFLFAYVPMAGLIMAFKKLDYQVGIWKSPFCWFDNFKFLFASKDILFNMTKNTLMYYVIFTAIGTFLNIVVAISFDQLILKKLAKVMQSIVIIPVFISYAAVQFIVFAYLNNNTGMINEVFNLSTRWYSTPSAWPIILTIVKMWNSVGYGSVLYMSVLAGVDTQLYEAAKIDGANKWKQIWHVSLPSLIPMISVMLLLSVGSMMHSDTGLFYQVTRNAGTLYPTTRVVDSYVLNMILHSSEPGFTAAASLLQSVIGTAMILLANFAVRKIEPDNALF